MTPEDFLEPKTQMLMNQDVIRKLAVGLTCISLATSVVSTAFAQGDGIYADFNTSIGSFTCRLEHAVAPRTVANFIGLATGQRAWLDLSSGQVKNSPFYNGTTFHRVIAGFMNQGGSPNGQGTDGPGYQFVDDFTPTLRHDGFGVLSMANSGPDSNGSQYFITVSAQPQLDDVHSVFGRLIGGSNVVYAINHVTTGANNKPLTNVVVQNVVIRRIGAAAQAFDIHAHGLALVTRQNLSIAKAGVNLALTFSNQLYAHNRFYSSTNLVDWTAMPRAIPTAAPVANTQLWSPTHPQQFIRLVQVQYPPSLFVPAGVLNRTLTLVFSDGIGTVVVNFDNVGGGTYTYSQGSPGTVISYNWIQDPYRGRLSPLQFSGLVPMVLHLDFDSDTAGTFKGTAYPSGSVPFAVSGTFGAAP